MTPYFVFLWIYPIGIPQPTPIQPFPVLELYCSVRFGCIPLLPGGTSIGIAALAAPVFGSVATIGEDREGIDEAALKEVAPADAAATAAVASGEGAVDC